MMDTERLELLAHELRSPVAALLAIEDALRGSDPEFPPAGRRRLLELAVAAGRDIERLLADPELFSLRVERTDVASLVEAFASTVVETAAEPGLDIDADPVRMRQLLANLVANGLRHGSRVRVDAHADGGNVVIEVSDDGPGIDQELDPFEAGVSGTGSTGLGLYVARRIAEAHGGALVLSPSSSGARFRLSLPRASGAAS